MGSARYIQRLADTKIPELMSAFPAVLVLGPRGVGKTTTASRHVSEVIRLDREAEAAAFRADPDAALQGVTEPVLLDEWQEVPGVLGAVKRAVDVDSRPGRFLLTGSVRAELDAASWPGTGRLVRFTMWGVSARESFGDPTRTSVVDLMAEHGIEALRGARSGLNLRDYVDLALRSGFPATLHRPPDEGSLWLASYVDQLVTRDVELVDRGRDPDRVRRYLQALATNTAGVVADKTLYEAAGINRRTAVAYEQLLKNLLVVDWAPAWSTNRLKRLVRTPKRYVTDAGLLRPLLPVDASAVMRDGDLLGRVLDTFVASQLRAELGASGSQARIHHLRTKEERHEIDLLIETSRGILAFEVKASASPTQRDARHLRWLADQLGPGFLLGVVLHTGPRSFDLGDGILAAPISSLWDYPS